MFNKNKIQAQRSYLKGRKGGPTWLGKHVGVGWGCGEPSRGRHGPIQERQLVVRLGAAEANTDDDDDSTYFSKDVFNQIFMLKIANDI